MNKKHKRKNTENRSTKKLIYRDSLTNTYAILHKHLRLKVDSVSGTLVSV